MHIEGNDLPGGEFDYDVNVRQDNVNPNYRSLARHGRIEPQRPAVKKWQAFVILFFGFICFGMGVSVGRGAGQERAYEQPSAPIVASPTPVVVTETRAVPTVPGSCMLAFDKLAAMQGDLEIIIDSSKDQVRISNEAYVAIVAKRVEDIRKATSDQYDLKRKTSSASLQLQVQLAELQKLLTQCRTDLGR